LAGELLFQLTAKIAVPYGFNLTKIIAAFYEKVPNLYASSIIGKAAGLKGRPVFILVTNNV
jgi:hypothetical protein